MTNQFKTVVSLVFAVIFISGCEIVVTDEHHHVPEEQPYSLDSVRAMESGDWYRFELEGYDSNGDLWDGTVTRIGQEPRWVEGVWVTPVMTKLKMTHLYSGAYVERTTTLYLDSRWHEVRLDFDNGVVCYPLISNDLPEQAYLGDYGDLGVMSCSDGREIEGVWDLSRYTETSADFLSQTTIWDGNYAEHTTETTQTITRSGEVIGYELSLYLMEYDVSLWLSSWD